MHIQNNAPIVHRPLHQKKIVKKQTQALPFWQKTIMGATVGFVAMAALAILSKTRRGYIPTTPTNSLWEKVQYPLTSAPIDVIIPSAPRDISTLEACIKGIRENGRNIGRVYVVSKERLTDSAEWVAESVYPFSKRDIIVEIFGGNQTKADQYLNSPNSRAGWIFQQFLKLYAPFVIPKISPNTLILDADTIFVNPTSFMTKEGNPIFNPARERYFPYFRHAQCLLPGFQRVHRAYSGVSNHMLMQRSILEDLFNQIHKQHNMEPWKALSRSINQNMVYESPLSEYELYFNYALSKTDQAKIHPQKWGRGFCQPDHLEGFKNEQFSFITCDSWAESSTPLTTYYEDFDNDPDADKTTVTAL